MNFETLEHTLQDQSHSKTQETIQKLDKLAKTVTTAASHFFTEEEKHRAPMMRAKKQKKKRGLWNLAKKHPCKARKVKYIHPKNDFDWCTAINQHRTTEQTIVSKK